MSEYLINAGRREQLRNEARRLAITADSHQESLRLLLAPTVNGADLPAEKILSLAAALAENVTALREVQAKIKAVNDLIGQG